MIGDWPCPTPNGGTVDEYAFVLDRSRQKRVLILPAWFEEASRMRRFTVEVMRRLDEAGVDSFLPDLPGCNESLSLLANQTPDGWRDMATAAAKHFNATHVLGIRGGGLILPASLPGWHYAPVKGAGLLRHMLRARIFTAREAGVNETQDGLVSEALEHGIELAGYAFSSEFIRQFQNLVPTPRDGLTELAPQHGSGGALWLRAEPGEDPEAAKDLATQIIAGLHP